MPRPLIDVPFDPNKPLVVRKPINANGRHYRPGDKFDWRKQGLVTRRVKMLYDQRKVVHEDSSTFPDIQSQREEVAQPPVREPDAVERVTDNLDRIDDMKTLKSIAEKEGAPIKRSKDEQREAIRSNR